MDFDFTQEQVMLRDLTREFLTRESTPRAVRTLMDDARGFSDATWQQLAEMGLQGLAIDAGYGGQGLGMIELALVLDEMGRAAYPGPYFATVVLAAAAIAAGGRPSQMARYLPDIASGRTQGDAGADRGSRCRGRRRRSSCSAERRGDEFVLSGIKRFVPFAHVADLILVVARTSASDPDGTTVFAVPSDAPGCRQKPNVEMDHTNRTSTRDVRGRDRVGADAVIGAGRPRLARDRSDAAAGGGRRRGRDARRGAPVHGDERRVRQGAPAVRPADRHVPGDQARLRRDAARGRERARRRRTTRRGRSTPAAGCGAGGLGRPRRTWATPSRKVCGSSIQVHGGIGFTWEYDLHLYFKRAKHFEPLYGDADFHRERALQLVLARSAADEVSG